MKDLILRLMKIEEKAQSITADERRHLENLDTELARAEIEKNSEIDLRANNRIEKMKAETERETKKKLEEIEKRRKAKTRALDECFEKNLSRWSKRIYEEIISL